jgi:hypothetical protein
MIDEDGMGGGDGKLGFFNLWKVLVQAPIMGMDKVLCVGMNYRDHCAEQVSRHT